MKHGICTTAIQFAIVTGITLCYIVLVTGITNMG